MAFGDTDLLQLLGPPFGVDVVFGANAPTPGLFAETDSPADFGGFAPAVQMMPTDGLDIAERRTFVFVAASAFDPGAPLAALAEDSPITVDGASYYARRFGPTEDGRIYRITLAAA